MENYQDLNGNNSTDYPLHTNSTFIIEPSLESELKKLLENKNKSKDIKLDKISFLSKNIQSIGNGIPLIFCNITRLYLSNNNIVSLEGIEQFANLTHLSISYNLIEDIYELNHIINPEILLHLNVKGNFFCKNPSFEEVILNLFINLKTLDDLKINNTHKKMIKYGQELSKYIMLFLLDINEKINKISILKKVYNLNNEYNLINSSDNNLNQFNKDNLNSLIEEFNNIDEASLYQILSLINEKRLVNNNNYLLPINELNKFILQYLNNTTENLITSENNKIKEIFSTLFFDLILNQKRKDYRGFLNYLIMTSEQKLLEFIKSKVDNLMDIENDKASINIICQNFEKILLKYSDYSIENINEIQMMIFYLYFNGNNIISNGENDIKINIDEQNGMEKIILNNYEQKIINFREMIPDFFPIFALDQEFMKSLINYLKDNINTFLLFINEMKQIRQNNKLKNQIVENNNMNLKNSIEKDNINFNNDEIVNIKNNQNEDEENINIDKINKEMNLQNSKDIKDYNLNKQEENIINKKEDNEEYNLNEPFIYNSQSNFYDKNNINNNNNIENAKNSLYIEKNNINTTNNYKNINNQNNLSEKEVKNEEKNMKNEIIPIIKPNQEKIQMKYNIIQLNKLLNKIIYINKIIQKKSDFIKLLKIVQNSSKIVEMHDSIESIWLRHKLNKFINRIKKNKISKTKKKRSISKNKVDIINEKMDENEQLEKKAKNFYYNNLKKKILLIFKYNLFLIKENLNKNNNIKFEQNIHKYNDSMNDDIYKFFHGDKKGHSELKEKKSKNNININEHNNSIKLNNINLNNLNNSEENKIKLDDYNKDKNYDDALKLRNILYTKKDIIEEENIEETKMNNLEKPKNDVDELLNNLKNLYKEIDSKTIKTNKSIKSNKTNEYDKRNKDYINKLKEIREKEQNKARKKFKSSKLDENKLLGCPNFIKNTYSSVLKNVY